MAKQWTEEQRKAFGEKMRASRQAKLQAARQNKNVQNEEVNQQVAQPTIEQKQTIADNSDVSELKREVEELKQMLLAERKQKAIEGQEIAGGKLVGTYEKYSTAEDRYPSPIDRLMEEPKLQQFAFKINYELEYEVGVSEYTTIDNIRTKEPKFHLSLIRVIMDEDTGEATSGRYIICDFTMHEDPDAALVIARDSGLDVETDDEASFLNEMRYLRMRNWLLECFFPAPIQKKVNKKEMVIDGKLVTFFEKDSPEDSKIGFEKIYKS